MKKTFLTFAAIIFALSLKSQDLVGTWNGTLSVQGHNLRVVFNITKEGDTYSATMDSPDQGTMGLPVGSITLEENRVRMSISIPQAPPAEYIGELTENTITGNFRQMGMSFPLNLTRAGDEQAGRANGFLRGRLFDSQTREPLLFSSVALISDADSSLLTGVITDEDGRFLLENLSYGHYRLRISNIGYHTFISNSIELRRGNNRLDLGSFFINPSTTQLTAVEIVAAVPILEQQAGRLVFNVSQSTTSVGDNALETLRQFPGVVVDNDDNITISGRSVLVTIDGRETHLSGDQLANLLRSMPSEQIDRIEHMDNPGARFSAEGISGILNIRTRRTRMVGYSGTVFAGATYDRNLNHNQGFDLNFRNNRITMFANLNHSVHARPAGIIGFTDFPNGMRREVNQGENEDWGLLTSPRFISGRGGIDFHINSRNILSLSYRHSQGSNTVDGNLFNRVITANETVLSSFQQYFSADNSWGNQNLSLNYQHIFDSANQRQFFIDASWLRNFFEGGGRDTISHYSGDFNTLSERVATQLNTRLPSDILSVRFDLEFPINRETRIETGVRYSFVNNDNNQLFLTNGDTNWDMTNQYIYSEHISAAYVQINHTFSPRLSIEAGLRFEHTALRGDLRRDLITTDSIHTNSYWGLFPSLNVSQQLTDRTGLNFSYSYRLRRPDYMLLNPMVARNFALDFREGNPYLMPQYTHLFSLAYTFNHIPIIRVTYGRSDGEIRQIAHFRGDTTWTRPENLGRNDAVALGLMYQHTFFGMWRVMANVGGEYSRTHFKYNDVPTTREFFNARYFISNNITLSPTMSMDVNSWGMFPRRHLFTRNTGMYAVNIGFRKSFFNRALTATINVNDVFNTANRWTNDTRLPTGQRDFQEQYWASRSVSVRLSYRFGQGNVQTRRMRDAAAEEAGRMGGGDGGQGGGMDGM
ncbi:MAG: TonB-dependent receptor [Bacteroidales bacterium]|nr:TonB-dependent receptor [Bacteroidales bacterium]